MLDYPSYPGLHNIFRGKIVSSDNSWRTRERVWPYSMNYAANSDIPWIQIHILFWRYEVYMSEQLWFPNIKTRWSLFLTTLLPNGKKITWIRKIDKRLVMNWRRSKKEFPYRKSKLSFATYNKNFDSKYIHNRTRFRIGDVLRAYMLSICPLYP